jgi:Salmonella virulence plasmid 65kDa B protein
LPRYFDDEESDAFILSGAEDLVPILININHQWKRHSFDSPLSEPGYTVWPYRPRIEGLFARIERWKEKTTGISNWRSISKDNITTVSGKPDDARIADPADPTRIKRRDLRSQSVPIEIATRHSSLGDDFGERFGRRFYRGSS